MDTKTQIEYKPKVVSTLHSIFFSNGMEFLTIKGSVGLYSDLLRKLTEITQNITTQCINHTS